MNPRNGISPVIAAAVAGELLSLDYMMAPPASSFTPQPAVGAPATFTPEMREMVVEEMEFLKKTRSDLNAKGRKKLARARALELMQK